MKRLWLIPVVLVALLVPAAVVLAGSGEGAFDGVVSSIESRYHVHATRIPFMGVLSLISHKATHGGVAGIHVAEFENFSDPVDGDELNRMVEQKLGTGWQRMIRETSRRGKEQTLIFVHPEGSRMGMFIVDKDGNEMDVVQVSVDPDHLNENIARYNHSQSDDDDHEAVGGVSN
ncbi:MAG TPA: hypothetical protein VMW15_15680 [Terracidiphilus sp.]|jgi:hypothetical protein|nr:hypothetical protein [Terracidiphilus sp.]HUX27708.1 hypothetical protein [Terracidiphilus sp.]